MADALDRIITRRPVIPKGSHKGRQASHNAATGKYVRQRARTTANKAKAVAAHLANHPNDLQAHNHFA